MTTLAYLASFHAVCQTLNISAAAKTLRITQPSLSKQLRRLEESLGLTLFVRRQRGIALTEDGAKLAEVIGPVLTTLTERLGLLSGQAGSIKGHLRIGSLTEIGKSLVLPRTLAFASDYPDVEIDLRLLKGSEIIAALQTQDLDFGIVTEMPAAENLRVSKLAEERSLIVTRTSNEQYLTEIGDVMAARFVAYRQDDPLLNHFLRTFYPKIGKHRIKPQITVNDHKSMIEALLSFDFYAVMPIHSVAGYLEAGTLHAASGHELHSKIWLVRPEKTRTSRIVAAFESFLTR